MRLPYIPGLTINHSTTGDVPQVFSVVDIPIIAEGTNFSRHAFHRQDGTLSTPVTTSYIFDFNQPIINLTHELNDIDGPSIAAPARFEILTVEAFFGAIPVAPCTVATGANITVAGTVTAPIYTSNYNTDDAIPRGFIEEELIRVTSTFCSAVDKIIVTANTNWSAGALSTFTNGSLLPSVEPVPTLSQWMLLLLALMLIVISSRAVLKK